MCKESETVDSCQKLNKISNSLTVNLIRNQKFLKYGLTEV